MSQRECNLAIRTYQNHTPTLGERAFVDCSAVVIGDVEIGADSSIWPLTVIRGDMHLKVMSDQPPVCVDLQLDPGPMRVRVWVPKKSA